MKSPWFNRMPVRMVCLPQGPSSPGCWASAPSGIPLPRCRGPPHPSAISPPRPWAPPRPSARRRSAAGRWMSGAARWKIAGRCGSCTTRDPEPPRRATPLGPCPCWGPPPGARAWPRDCLRTWRLSPHIASLVKWHLEMTSWFVLWWYSILGRYFWQCRRP